ncbi:MAG: CRISPR-associated helicase Cas3' [Pseudomonadales bacterium]|nr:CRISPR-associated helicase Cas3' [Pseudomonadales bacterium]
MIRRSKQVSDGEFPVVSFAECPAKTFLTNSGLRQGRSVLNHCQIVGEVAKEIIARYPFELRAKLFPDGAVLAAASHDIGKVSPFFLEKILQACGQGSGRINPQLEREWGGHAGVSEVTAKALGAPRYVPEILGQHHGFSPQVAGRRAHDDVFGGLMWQQEREALVQELKARLGVDWPQIESIPQARLVAGLTSVSDWIGSGQFFENPAVPWLDNIVRSLDEAGFILPTYQPSLSFQEVFEFDPRPAQQQLIDAVIAPGVYVLEAPMGMGKTEAALYAAYRMLKGGHASGIYFALPTQLTSNKIYERFNAFLSQVVANGCQHRSLLLHGSAWMLQESEMGEEGSPGGAWFHHAKRGLLAPFAVGTVDQALMAAMNVKHGFVRAFGLAGKVVILDEVHTYDAYTGTLLDALVELLRALHCTVIILSATLSRDRRQQLLNCDLDCDAYPLITALPNSESKSERAIPVEFSHHVHIRLWEQDRPAIDEAIVRASGGQQVLWIENSIADAQERYLDIAARAVELGLDCGLLHSRFTADDRQGIEDQWVGLFGKPGREQRHLRGRILVGTQVLEQSLDIDADFLISRFAPTDMILQRLGRLWRHPCTPRPVLTRCEAWLLAPSLECAVAAPQQAFGSTAFVYSPYVLCRSLEVWQGLTALQLPNDIRQLIEQTYISRSEEGLLATYLHELDHGTRWRTGRHAMRQLARVTLAESGNTLPESKAQTRYSEADSYEVLLLRQISLVPDQESSWLTLLNGDKVALPWDRHRLSKGDWRKLSACLMRQVISVRPQDAPLQVAINILKKIGLHHCFYLGSPEQDEAILRVALVDEMGVLHGIQGSRIHDKYTLNYRNDLGYRVIKN